MLRMVLTASLSVANSGHTVTAGKSSSLSLTLSMVLVLGSSSQELKTHINICQNNYRSLIWEVSNSIILRVSVLNEKSQESNRAADKEHPDQTVEPVLCINPVPDPMDRGFLVDKFIFKNLFIKL